MICFLWCHPLNLEIKWHLTLCGHLGALVFELISCEQLEYRTDDYCTHSSKPHNFDNCCPWMYSIQFLRQLLCPDQWCVLELFRYAIKKCRICVLHLRSCFYLGMCLPGLRGGWRWWWRWWRRHRDGRRGWGQ